LKFALFGLLVASVVAIFTYLLSPEQRGRALLFIAKAAWPVIVALVIVAAGISISLNNSLKVF
jgi:hypothetical protein